MKFESTNNTKIAKNKLILSILISVENSNSMAAFPGKTMNFQWIKLIDTNHTEFCG